MTTEQRPIASLAEIRALRDNLPGRDQAAETEAVRRNAILTKPPGALADLEDIAIFMAGWQGRALPVRGALPRYLSRRSRAPETPISDS